MVSDAEFKQTIATVKAEAFDDTRLQIMKSALKNRQAKISRVTALIGVFDFGEEKVETGVFCYPRVVDKGPVGLYILG